MPRWLVIDCRARELTEAMMPVHDRRLGTMSRHTYKNKKTPTTSSTKVSSNLVLQTKVYMEPKEIPLNRGFSVSQNETILWAAPLPVLIWYCHHDKPFCGLPSACGLMDTWRHVKSELEQPCSRLFCCYTCFLITSGSSTVSTGSCELSSSGLAGEHNCTILCPHHIDAETRFRVFNLKSLEAPRRRHWMKSITRAVPGIRGSHKPGGVPGTPINERSLNLFNFRAEYSRWVVRREGKLGDRLFICDHRLLLHEWEEYKWTGWSPNMLENGDWTPLDIKLN